MSRHEASLPADYFAGMYAGDPDPWSLSTSPYERDKYAATLAHLPRARYGAAFEPACATGVFTRALAERCDRLVAWDLVPAAVEAARARCADRPWIVFGRGAVPADWPDGRFDLIVLSEFLYFLDAADLAGVAARVGASLAPGGDVVLVHWTGETDYPHSGDAAAAGFIAHAAPFADVLKSTRAEAYRIDVLRQGKAA